MQTATMAITCRMMRSARVCAALLILGCGALDPERDDRYTLRKVNGVALPAEVVNETTAAGRQHRVEVIAGFVSFFPRGTFRSGVTLRSTWTGPAGDTLSVMESSGAFEMLKDTVAQVRFRDGNGWQRTNYRIVNDGELLRAIQGFGGTLAVYDYHRP